MDLPAGFFVRRVSTLFAGRRDITHKGKGEPHPTATYEHELFKLFD